MATVDARSHEEGMSVGRVFRRAFGTLIHNPAPTLGLAFLLGAVPGLIIALLVQGALRADPNQVIPSLSLAYIVVMLFSYVVMFVLSAIVQAALTRATVAESQGRKASFGECIRASLPVALPLIGLVILWAIAIVVASIFLFIPAVILACMWAVMVPAMVEERVGIFGAFGRSRALTKGNRWKVFGVLVVFMIAYWLLLLIVGLVVDPAMLTDPNAAAAMTPGLMVMSVITGTLFNAVWGTLAPSMYVDLRQRKDGGSAEDLEEVFA